MCPPTNCYNSDEDSGEEDEADINRFTKHQLLANAEANLTLIQDGEVISEHITISNFIEPEPNVEGPMDAEDSSSPKNNTKVVAPAKLVTPKRKNEFSPLPSTSSVTSILADDQPSPSKKRKVNIESKKEVKSNVSQSETKKGKQAKKEKKYSWIKKDVEGKPNKEWELPQWLSDEDRSPVELFELFYDFDLISFICDMTNKYASEKGEPNGYTLAGIKCCIGILIASGYNHVPRVKMYWETKDDVWNKAIAEDMTNKYASEKGEPNGYTLADIKCFIGILIASGYNHVPRVKMYWETKDDVWNKAIAEAMPRNKFLNIMRCLHVCDNTNLDKNTKFAKIAPLWQMLNERWLKYFAGDANLSIDESMIPYYGRHSAKQHIHGKPIRFGYKAWCLCSRFGYLTQAIPYEGASSYNKYPDIGVGGSVVMELSEKLPPRHNGYNLFFDNFFTSVTLLEVLKENGNTGTGTVKANRVCKAPLTDVTSMKRKPRGAYEQLTEEKSELTLVRYNDNNVVTVASTYCGVEPIGKVRRYSAADKKHMMVPQPACVVIYNQYMGGVDRLDENISEYRIGIRGKKWYWQMLAFPINVSVNNAWLLYRLTTIGKEKPLDLLSFTREITLTYLKKYSSRVTLGRPLHYKVGAVDKRVTANVRYDNEGHMIGKSEKQTRCGQCKKNSTMKCIKCDVALHSKCFVQFHSK